MHVAGEGQASHERQCAEAIDHVIYVEAIAGPLLLAHSGEGAVEAVSQPVEGEKYDYRDEPVSVSVG